MATLSPLQPTTHGGALIELDEEVDGDEIGSRNYRFSKIGEPVPIKSDDTAEFDPQCLPSQPLAVSERFRLLFVAHPQGFCVARTKDVMASAEDIKEKRAGPSVQELSLVDVSIGKISILALSTDESMLAACVANNIHFFAVSALLHKEQKPSYSVSLDDSICIKDMRWAKNIVKVYLILSTNGKLYHSSGQGPPIYVMEDVDSVDWSAKGNFVAVAKKNTISILSSMLKEKIRFLLKFQSLVGDSNVNQVIKVDTIRWIRPDCIAVGCFQLNEDGEEENYVVQLITSRGRRITDEAADPIVLSFNNVFMDFCSDAVPARNGPHMFLSFLDLYGLAFIANRNLSQNVGLFCWSVDNGKNEAAMVEILNDAWTLYIDSQDNGEENVILGLSIDKASQNENIRFTLGNEEKEVSPCCVVICLTIDGKISVFHFASAAGALVSPEGWDSDEEDDTSQVSVPHEQFVVSSAVSEESRKSTFLASESPEHGKLDVEKITDCKVAITNDSSPSCHVDITSREQTAADKTGQQNLVNPQTVKIDEPQKAIPRVANQDTNDSSPSCHVDITSREQTAADKTGQQNLVNPQTVKTDEPQKAIPRVANQDTNDSSPSCHVDITSREQTAADKTGQQNLVNPQTVKIDEPQKAIPRVANQDSNEGIKPYPKQSTDIFRGKVSLSGRNVEPSGKVPPKTSSGWSLTRSTVKVEPKGFDGKLLSLPSGEVGNAEEHASRSTGGALRYPTDLKEKAKPSVSFTSIGQIASIPQGSGNFLSAYPGKVPFGESGSSGKPSQSEFKDVNVVSSRAGLPYSSPNSLKQFGNVEEMAKKMDNLLEGIEGVGGFRDACITSQKNHVVELEEGIWSLSERCRRQRGLMDEQLREVQLLLDKTVQVLVRKVYMEGIFKQATDSRYWELWNRQKLSSELELKQRRILELNQELTNKLIELERHFNALEFNKFGEDGEIQNNRRVLLNWHGHSRQTHSFHSLHNTMHAQLAAAEQLSGCLSKQMAALSIESSGKHDMKKKLFESIGLSYAGGTETSPARSRTFSTPLNKERVISGSTSAKEQSKRNQASFVNSYEPETARRNRACLDSSWDSFDPPKTTVKRILKEDYEKGSARQSFLNLDKRYLSPQSEKNSEVAHSKLLNVPGASLNHFKSKEKKSAESPSTLLNQREGGLLDRGTYMLSSKTLPAVPPQSIWETRTGQNSEIEGPKHIDDKSKSSLPFAGRKDFFAASESKFVLQSDTGRHPLSSMSRQLPERSLASASDSTESLDHSKFGFTLSAKPDQKSAWGVSQIPSLHSKAPVAPASVFSSGPNVSEKGLFPKSSEKPSWSNDSLSTSAPSQSAFSSSLISSTDLSSLSSIVPKPSISMLPPAMPSSSGSSMAVKKELSQPQISVPSTLKFPSSLPLSSDEGNISSVSASSRIIKAEFLTPLSSPYVAIYGSKTESSSQGETSVANKPSETANDVKLQTSASQNAFGISTSDLKIEPSKLPSPIELSINSKSWSQIESGGSPKSSSVTSAINTLELPSETKTLSPAAQSSEGTFGSVNNVVSDSSHEEEMDEEAPETDQTSESALRNLGGFGLGSTPSSTTPKANPFGVADPSRSTNFASSPYAMSAPSGELFRPASFSFQSAQTQAPSQPANVVNFSGGFNSGSPGQVSAASGFGQAAHIGAGQQVLGSVLGTFGQSRQLGAGLPGSNVTSASGFGGTSSGGFPGGGFASLATGSVGFAAAPTAGGGFAAAATAGGGFAAAANAGGAISGGGFGAFSNQQGSGLSAFSGGGSGTGRPPSELFTQMRR